jgi:hypothetical protein
MFVRVDGEDNARNVFRRAQNSISSDGKEWKVKEFINNSENNIFKGNFPQENTNYIFFHFQIIHFRLFASYGVDYSNFKSKIYYNFLANN